MLVTLKLFDFIIFKYGAQCNQLIILDIIEKLKAILLGAPVTASGGEWKQVCSVVGGRVINGYCETDWLLRLEN